MAAKEKENVTAAIRRFIKDCRASGRTEFRTSQIPGINTNTMDARVARYGMAPHRSEYYMTGRFYYYFRVEELAAAIGERAPKVSYRTWKLSGITSDWETVDIDAFESLKEKWITRACAEEAVHRVEWKLSTENKSRWIKLAWVEFNMRGE